MKSTKDKAEELARYGFTGGDSSPVAPELQEPAREALLRGYAGSQTCRAAARVLTAEAHDRVRERWCSAVLDLRVDMRPGGRAVVSHAADTFTVEVQWRVSGSDLLISSIHVVELEAMNEGVETYGLPDVAQHVTAVYVFRALSSKPIPGPIPGARPAAGRPTDTGFYRELLKRYRALVNGGHRAPAKELAAKYGVKHPTMKTWLRRARLLEGKENG